MGALAPAAAIGAASASQTSSPSPPATDSPALPHGSSTLQALAGGHPPTRATTTSQVPGLDVASYQHPGGAAINWSQVAAAGYRFALVKATQGTYYTNPYFSGDYAAVEAAGMFRAAYHFADPSASGGAAQADYLLNAAPYAADGLTLARALDLENLQGVPFCYGLSTSGMVAWIAAFSNEVGLRTGRLPIIYTRAGWWNQCTGNSAAFAGNPLWVANYGASSPTLPAGWVQWTYWQWTSTGTVPGISGNVDLSYFNGDASALGPSTWSSLGGSLGSGPAAAAWAANRVDVFAADAATGALIHRWWDGSQWGGYEGLGGVIATGAGPAAVSWGPNRIDVFVRGSDDGLWHRWWNSAGWSGWEPLGGVLTSSPTVSSWAGGRLDVSMRGSDQAIWHRWWASAGWSGWESLGGVGTSAPGATSWGPGRIDLFVRGTDNALWHRWWDGAGWSGWESLGGALTSAPAASSWGPGRIDVVALLANGIPNHRFWINPWSSWFSLGGSGVGDPAIIDRSPGTIDAFVGGTDGALWHLPVPAG
jgi:GH25 family lysozyme M1 (1,4-beta-N-acetylmuramidase)